jgi:hypothetical protein
MFIHSPRVRNFSLFDTFESLYSAITSPWRGTLDKLVNDDAKCPQVREGATITIIQHFWSDEERCTNESTSIFSNNGALFQKFTNDVLIICLLQMFFFKTFEHIINHVLFFLLNLALTMTILTMLQI